MTTMHMMKVPEYPRPHEFDYNFAIPVESASIRGATIVPLVTYDEGLGAMSAYKSNPSNAAFVEVATDHCFPTSKVNRIFAELRVSMSKVLRGDSISQIRFATATIHTAFDEGAQAKDEVSTLDLNEILELDKETTDRQTYPLWNDVDLADYKTNAGLDMPAETPGLDTDLEIEAVAFNIDDYYDCLHYYTNGHKLRTICTPLQWHTIVSFPGGGNMPTKTIHFQQQSNTKFLNPYTLLAGLIYVPQMPDIDQYGKVGDTTVETASLEMTLHVRYNEFNHEFNHSML